MTIADRRRSHGDKPDTIVLIHGLWMTLSDEQRELVIEVLGGRNLKLPPDSARRGLVERILKGMERDTTPLAAS